MVETESFKTLCVLAVTILAHVSSLPTPNPDCLNALAPPTNSRGVNRVDRISQRPLFQLHITPGVAANGSNDEHVTYQVQVKLENELLAFSDAKISIAAPGPCGSGSLTFDSQGFVEAKQTGPACPRLLLTNQKRPMMELPPLFWTPPSCGCVQFRALVIEAGTVYYADQENVESGALSQNVCVHKKATREQFVDALCHVGERYSAAEILSRTSFLARHQLEARWMDRHGLEMALELRRSDNRHCCSQKNPEAKRTCFEDTRRRRVDRFCEDGYPDIPFSSFRLSHMREKEKTCCFILGEHRYSCFASNSELVSKAAVTSLDFSQDETDPINDLAEFASLRDTDILQRIRSITFGRHDTDDESNIGGETENEDGDDENDNEEDPLKDDGKMENDDDDASKMKAMKNAEREMAKHKKEKDMKDAEPAMAVPVLTDDTLVFPRLDVSQRKPASKIFTADESSFVASPKATLTSAERRQTARSTNGLRNGRKWNGESFSSRRRASREYLDARRRVSAEILGRRRASAERDLMPGGSEPWIPGYGQTYSEGAGLSQQVDLLTSAKPRLTSAERRPLVTSSSRKRDGWSDHIGEANFDDEGGVSVEETLDKLQRKMERLRLKSQCCEAGAVAGRQVYGSFTHTWNECGHSADKYVVKTGLISGTKPCIEQFRKCCVELAVSGPVMTSSEFRDTEFMYLNNLERLDPASEFDRLHRTRGHQQEKPGEASRRHYHPDSGRDALVRETPEAYEVESEKGFQSMRTVGDDRWNDGEEDEEYDGPRRFDEIDNNQEDVFDPLHREDETPKKKPSGATADEEIEDFDDRTFTGNDEDEEKDFEDTLGKQSVFTKKERTVPDKNRHKEHDQLDRDVHHSRTNADHVSGTSRAYESPLLAVTNSKRSRSFRNSRERTSSRRRFRSRNSRRRSSRKRSSRRTSSERQQPASAQQRYAGLHKQTSYRGLGALDSQEQAAAHVRSLTGALDSKEMAAAYIDRRENDRDFQNDAFASHFRSTNRRRYSRRRNY